MSRGLVRTLRIRSNRKAGVLGILTTALGDAGASIGEISTLKIGHNYTLRDFSLLLDDVEHLQSVLDAVSTLADSDIVEVVNPVTDAHFGGKIRMTSRADLEHLTGLYAAVSPGAREMVRILDDNPLLADIYTTVQRTVAIITDGAELPGVGKVHARAMLPVLEGKAALLAKLAGLSALPLVLAVETEDEFIETVARIAPSCGAILLDAMAAPRGARAVQKLSDKLQMPLLHDDADGPAIIGLAAIINACKRVGRDIRDVTVGQIGLGTAGGAIARLVMKHTGNAVLGEDVHPAAVSRHVNFGGRASSMEEIMQKADVVVANTGHAGVISPSMVREGQVIIALSEPRPEIEPYDAMLAGAAFAVDGRAINTAVVFPGVLLGALAVKAKAIDDEMRIAAAVTMAENAEEGDLVPTPMQELIHAKVAAAVARAAVAQGLAQRKIDPALLTLETMNDLVAGRRHPPLGE